MNRRKLLLRLLEEEAKKYRLEANTSLKRHGHTNEMLMSRREDIPQPVIDALLVDFLNYFARHQNVDYELYVSRLRKS